MIKVSAQPSIQEINENIVGTWEGIAPITSRNSNLIKNDTIHVKLYIKFRLHLDRDGNFKIDNLKFEKYEILKAHNKNNKTLLNLLSEADVAYNMFLNNLQIESNGYRVFPPIDKYPILKLGINASFDAHSKKRLGKYFENDLREIRIKSISSAKMVLSIRTRSDWDPILKEYTRLGYEDVQLTKL